MSYTNNVGQVVGLYVGTTPPENTKLIWYDSTTSQRCHKVFDPTTKLWVSLNLQGVSNITYSELINAAKRNGLTAGKYYRITDKSNALALAITTTKVQYTDALGNILIDDLGTNIQYHVTSNNLLIDDIGGVFNVTTQKLVFTFTEASKPNFNEDYIFGKQLVGTAYRLVKWAWRNIISPTPGNSIVWDNGLYCSFVKALRESADKTGGVISYDKYTEDHNTIVQNINNVSKRNQQIMSAAKTYTDRKTNDVEIYQKTFPVEPSTTAEPGNLLKGQELQTIINNAFRWVNKLRWATGVRLTPNFKDADKVMFVNNNDTVESAISKIQYYVRNSADVPGVLKYVEQGATEYESTTKDATEFMPINTDTVKTAFAKVRAFFKNITRNSKLSSAYDATASGYNRPANSVVDLVPDNGDSVETALAKVRAILINLNYNLRFINNFDEYASAHYTGSNTRLPAGNESLLDGLAKICGYLESIYTSAILSNETATAAYNSIPRTRHIYEVVGTLKNMLAQLDYNTHHIKASMIENNTITYNQIANEGVFPTDIFRIDLTTNGFNFLGCSFGGLVIEGYNTNVFADSDMYPDNPYRLDSGYSSNTKKILAFIPVIPTINGSDAGNNYGNASSFVHIEDDITVQVLIMLKQTTITELKTRYNYFQVALAGDFYGYKSETQQITTNIRRVICCNINLTKAALTANGANWPHIILSVSLTPIS